MSTVSATSQVGSVIDLPPSFTPYQPEEVDIDDFNNRCSVDRKEVPEGEEVWGESKLLFIPGVAECITLLAIQVDKITQNIASYAGYHMTVDTTVGGVDDFVTDLKADKYDLYLYLIGGDQSKKSVKLLQTIKTSLAKNLGKNYPVVFELQPLVDNPSASSEFISVGLTKDGKVFWCYGYA